MARSKPLWLLISWFVVAILGLLILKWTGVWKHVDLNWVTRWLRDLGPLGGLLYILAYTLRPLVLFPATPLTLYGGYVFRSFLGDGLRFYRGRCRRTVVFLHYSQMGRGSFQRILRSPKLLSFDQKAEEKGFMVVLYMRLMPFFPFDGISYGAGIIKNPLLGLYVGNADWYYPRSHCL